MAGDVRCLVSTPVDIKKSMNAAGYVKRSVGMAADNEVAEVRIKKTMIYFLPFCRITYINHNS